MTYLFTVFASGVYATIILSPTVLPFQEMFRLLLFGD